MSQAILPLNIQFGIYTSSKTISQPQPHSFNHQQAGTSYSNQFYQQYPPAAQPQYYNPSTNWWQQYQEYYRYPGATATNPVSHASSEVSVSVYCDKYSHQR